MSADFWGLEGHVGLVSAEKFGTLQLLIRLWHSLVLVCRVAFARGDEDAGAFAFLMRHGFFYFIHFKNSYIIIQTQALQNLSR